MAHTFVAFSEYSNFMRFVLYDNFFCPLRRCTTDSLTFSPTFLNFYEQECTKKTLFGAKNPKENAVLYDQRIDRLDYQRDSTEK